MRDETLHTLFRLRRRAVDDARTALAEGLAAAIEAQTAARAAEQAIETEAHRASDPAGEDHLVEAFAAWLPGARHHVAQAWALHDRREAEVTRLRANLAACRSALEAITSMLEHRRIVTAGIRDIQLKETLEDWLARPPATQADPGHAGGDPID